MESSVLGLVLGSAIGWGLMIVWGVVMFFLSANSEKELKQLREDNEALRIINEKQERTISQLRTDVARLKWNVTTKERPNG